MFTTLIYTTVMVPFFCYQLKTSLCPVYELLFLFNIKICDRCLLTLL